MGISDVGLVSSGILDVASFGTTTCSSDSGVEDYEGVF